MSLEKLLENPRVWRGSSQVDTRIGLASGFAKLDRCLPGGGWPQQALTEILIEQYGVGELRLLMPALAQLSGEESHARHDDYSEPGWIAWIAPPFQPYAPALQQCGIDLSRMLVVRPKDDSELLWSAEQSTLR